MDLCTNTLSVQRVLLDSLKIVSASFKLYLPLATYMVLASNKKTLFDQTRCLATTTIAKDPNKTLNIWIITVLRSFSLASTTPSLFSNFMF